MAFDLRAVLKLDGNNFVRGMQRVERVTRNTERATGQMNRSMSTMRSNFRNASSGVSGLTKAFTGLAVAVGSAAAANKIFKSTVGAAMEREVSAITIDNMFDSKKASKAYQKMMKQLALDSPVLNYNEMAGGSKRLLSLTRDTKTLEKTWKNIEKLQAYAPDKSTDDAIRGIAELASGDIMSLREVFNLDKNQLNALKGLSFDKQVVGIEKMLTKMKITDDLIDKVGNTTYAKLNQVKEKFADIFAGIGGPSLDVLSKFFDNILTRLNGPDAQRFANIGARWIERILNGLTTNAIKLYDWFASLTSSEEWKNATTLSAKVNIIIDNLTKRFTSWYEEGGGKEQLEGMAKSLTSGLATFIEDNAPSIVEAGGRVGKSVGSALVSGIVEAINNNPIAKAIIGGAAGAAIGSVIPGIGTVLGGAVGAGASLAQHYTSKLTSKIFPKKKKGKAKASGLSYVPYNGYQATLHKGERILTPEENRQVNKEGGLGGGVTITGNQFIIREEADIDKIGAALVRKWQAALEAGA
jgi:hypothetical protein